MIPGRFIVDVRRISRPVPPSLPLAESRTQGDAIEAVRRAEYLRQEEIRRLSYKPPSRLNIHDVPRLANGDIDIREYRRLLRAAYDPDGCLVYRQLDDVLHSDTNRWFVRGTIAQVLLGHEKGQELFARIYGLAPGELWPSRYEDDKVTRLRRRKAARASSPDDLPARLADALANGSPELIASLKPLARAILFGTPNRGRK